MSDKSPIRIVQEITTTSDWIITLNAKKMLFNHVVV